MCQPIDLPGKLSLLLFLVATSPAIAGTPMVQALGVGTGELTAVSPDNLVAAIPVLSGVEIYWGPAAERVGFLPGIGSTVTRAMVSPDDARVAVEAGHVYLWDVDSQTPLGNGPLGTSTGLAGFSSDGSRLMTYRVGQPSASLIVETWNSFTGALVDSMEVPGSDQLVVAADWSVIATGGAGIHLWNLATETSMGTIEAPYTRFNVSTTNNSVVVLFSHQLFIYSIDTLQLQHQTELPHDEDRQAQISPDGSRLLVWNKQWIPDPTGDNTDGYWEHIVEVWDLFQKSAMKDLSYLPSYIDYVGFSADSSHLIKRLLAGGVMLVSLDGEEIWRIMEQPLDASRAFQPAISDDGSTVITVIGLGGWVDRGVALWDAESGSLLATRNWQRCGDVSEDAQRIVLNDQDHWDVVDFASQETLYTVPFPDSPFITSAISHDGALFLTYTDEQAIVWDDAGHTVCSYISSMMIQLAAFSPDGSTVATVETTDLQFKLVLWNAETGEVVNQSELLDTTDTCPNVRSIVFSPDGEFLLLNSGPGYLWNAHTGQFIKAILEETGPCFYTGVFSPDSRHIAAIFSPDPFTSVSIYDIESGEIQSNVIGYLDFIRSLAFFPDGRLLVDSSGPYSAHYTGDGFAAIYDVSAFLASEGEGEDSGEGEGESEDEPPAGCYHATD